MFWPGPLLRSISPPGVAVSENHHVPSGPGVGCLLAPTQLSGALWSAQTFYLPGVTNGRDSRLETRAEPEGRNPAKCSHPTLLHPTPTARKKTLEKARYKIGRRTSYGQPPTHLGVHDLTPKKCLPPPGTRVDKLLT